MDYKKQLVGATLLCTTLWSCGDDDTNNFSLPSSTVTLDKTSGNSSEGDGEQQLIVRLDKPQEGSTIINFQAEGSATIGISSYSHTDVELLTASPLVIEAGETEAFIKYRLIEDEVFEPITEQFSIILNSIVGGNAQLDAKRATYTHILEENDYELTLTWEAQAVDAAKASPDTVDLDLSVELPNSVYLYSNSQEGFEQLLLANISPPNSYQVNVWYYQGEADISYRLTYRSADAEERLLASGSFAHNEAGKEFDVTQGASVQNFRLAAVTHGLSIQ